MKRRQIGLVIFLLLLIVGCKKITINKNTKKLEGNWIRVNENVVDTFFFETNGKYHQTSNTSELDYKIISKDSIVFNKYFFGDEVSYAYAYEFSNNDEELLIKRFISSNIMWLDLNLKKIK